jgi:hypothetical protein
MLDFIFEELFDAFVIKQVSRDGDGDDLVYQHLELNIYLNHAKKK